MQINIALAENNAEQAALLRNAWYPNTTAMQTRDAFVFNCAIDRFDAGQMESLPEIIEKNNGQAIKSNKKEAAASFLLFILMY